MELIGNVFTHENYSTKDLTQTETNDKKYYRQICRRSYFAY